MKRYVCQIEACLDVIGGKWKIIILYYLLAQGPKRTSELKRLIPGISQKMLTQQLRELEADAVIVRKSFNQVPPKVEYSLSQHGKSLEPILRALYAWGGEHIQRVYPDEEISFVNQERE